MKDDIVEGYNWTNFPFREDPNTHQRICKDCWNGVHGQWKATSEHRHFVKGCLVDGCGCLCYQSQQAIKSGAATKREATKARKEAVFNAVIEQFKAVRE